MEYFNSIIQKNTLETKSNTGTAYLHPLIKLGKSSLIFQQANSAK